MLSTRHGNVLNYTIVGLSKFCPTIITAFSYMNLVKIGFNSVPKTKYVLSKTEAISYFLLEESKSSSPCIINDYFQQHGTN